MRKVKVLGETHPDELRQRKIIRALRHDPVPNVDVGIVNVLGRITGQRVVNNKNMSHAYPGNPRSVDYVECRASMVIAASKGYFTVCDIHDIAEGGENTAWIGSRGVDKQILGFLGHMGIDRLVYAPGINLYEHLPNSFLLELNAIDPRSDPKYLHDAFDFLANTPTLPEKSADDFEWYALKGDITEKQLSPSCLPVGIQGFDRLPEDIVQQIGHTSPLHMLGWVAKPNAQGYWAEVAAPIPTPDVFLPKTK